MAATRGRLDKQGSPLVRIGIFPEGRPSDTDQFDAVIDTGFTGLAQIPTKAAEAVGLLPTGTIDYAFADGTTQPVPVVFPSARLGAETREGFVIVSEGGDVLVGIHFLRLFRKSLTLSVGREVVELTDE
jgi:predicted aspartyl protease